MELESFSLSFSGSILLLISTGIILTIAAIFIYRYTLPKISKWNKIFLTSIRTLIFLLLLFLIFEPVLNSTFRRNNTKSDYIFLDFSSSIGVKDSSQRLDVLKNFLAYAKISDLDLKYYSFGKSISQLTDKSSISFSHNVTDYEALYKFIFNNSDKIKRAVIVSDGIITSGEDPTYEFEKIQIPLFTVGIGDSSLHKDIALTNIIHNQTIYINKETKIAATILNTGYSNRDVLVTFKDENNQIFQRQIKLNDSGVNKLEFTYKALTAGEHKLKLDILPLTGEFSTINNSKTIFINVLSTKIKVAIIAGAPSEDVSAITSSLLTDSNLLIEKSIQISESKFLYEPNNFKIDSSAVLFLVNFPSKNTPQKLIDDVLTQIQNGKPFFISVSTYCDLNKLKIFEKYLPVIFSSNSYENIFVQPELLQNEFISSFSQISSSINDWNKLSPINQLSANLLPKPESKVIVKSKIRDLAINNPLLVLRSIGNQRSFLFNGFNFWQWQLQNAEKNPQFFPNLFNETLKWLNVSNDKKRFLVYPSKQIYSQNELIEFTAELYDQSFNPIDTANISLKIKNKEKTVDLGFTAIGNGIYTVKYQPDMQGEFYYEATSSNENNDSNFTKGRFIINSYPVENLDTRLRVNYLKQLAFSTNGNYYSIEQYDKLIQYLKQNHNNNLNSVTVKKEYDVWNNSIVIILIILLFSIEWFTRKRLGML